ncbi:MAG: Plug domain-containing protein, partial [Bacteroidales bacterium]|nr:Plug domain-containing protein [Bacteroidales bacterium]
RKKFVDVPLKNSYVTIGIFKSGNPLLYTLPTDSTGRFYLERLDLTGDAKLIASVTGDKDKLKGWLLLDSVKYSPAIVKESIAQTKYIQKNDQSVSDDQLTGKNQLTEKKFHTFIQYAEFKSSIQRKYKLSDTITPGEVTITAKRQYSPESAKVLSERSLRTFIIDKEYVISHESEIYANIGQILEFKFHINVANISVPIPGTSDSSQSTPGTSLLGKTDPLFLLNGMEVGFEGVNFLPVDWVERIDYLKPINAALIWGIRGRGGVVSVILKSGAPTDVISPVYHSANIKFSGYHEPRIFYSPKHHTTLESDYKPDLRTTLFWEPNIKVDNNKDVFLNYFNADNSSIIRVIVEGITTNGIPVTGKAEYEVK